MRTHTSIGADVSAPPTLRVLLLCLATSSVAAYIPSGDGNEQQSAAGVHLMMSDLSFLWQHKV
jgi:hypothetical protein